MKNNELGENIYFLRKRKKLTQEDFAKKMKISNKTVSKWETGYSIPKFDDLLKISKYFNVPINVLINKEKYEKDVIGYEEDNNFVLEVKNVDTTKELNINLKGRDIEINAVIIINEDINSIITDLPIETVTKEKIANIIFSDLDVKKKRIQIRKIKKLDKRFVRMFIKLLEYIAEI